MFNSYVELPEGNYGLIIIESPFSYGFPTFSYVSLPEGRFRVSEMFSCFQPGISPTMVTTSLNNCAWWDFMENRGMLVMFTVVNNQG